MNLVVDSRARHQRFEAAQVGRGRKAGGKRGCAGAGFAEAAEADQRVDGEDLALLPERGAGEARGVATDEVERLRWRAAERVLCAVEELDLGLAVLGGSERGEGALRRARGEIRVGACGRGERGGVPSGDGSAGRAAGSALGEAGSAGAGARAAAVGVAAIGSARRALSGAPALAGAARIAAGISRGAGGGASLGENSAWRPSTARPSAAPTIAPGSAEGIAARGRGRRGGGGDGGARHRWCGAHHRQALREAGELIGARAIGAAGVEGQAHEIPRSSAGIEEARRVLGIHGVHILSFCARSSEASTRRRAAWRRE